MKRAIFPASILPILITAVIFYSCETFTGEEETICLPVNMTATIVQGSSTGKIIADYHYIPGTDRLDHITWSNHQTHYFEYDGSGRIRVVRQMKVDTKVQEEMWFHYEGNLVDRVLLVQRNLDYIFLEPLDSACTGHIEFAYEGDRVVSETRYETGKCGTGEKAVREVVYEYDGKGNIVSSICSDSRKPDSEVVTMTYDQNRHPLSGLQYYFTGESFVNNLLSRNLEDEGLEYSYEIRLNEFGYPDIITEKLGTTHSRIIRYSYMSL